jgi:hypothetical protein
MGCASSMPPSLAPLPQRPPIPQSLLQPCQPLSPLAGTTGADVIQKFVEVGQMYNECADGKAALIKASK